MPIIQHSVTINRPITEVFRFITDFHNSTQWQSEGTQLQRAGQVKVGDMIVGTRRVMGRVMHVNADVVELVPNQQLAYTGIMGSYPFRTTYKFSFSGSGCELTEIMDIRIMWLFFMIRPFIVRSIDGQMQASLARLKTVLESRFR